MPVVLKRICDTAEKIVTLVSAGLLLILVVLVCGQVFARFLFNVGLTWVADISTKLMMWIGLLGAAGCIWTDTHMRLNLFLDKIPEAVRLWVHVAIDLLLGVFSAFIFVSGVEYVTVTAGGTMDTLPFVSQAIPNFVLPVAAALMMVFSAMNIVRRIWEHFSKKETGENG